MRNELILQKIIGYAEEIAGFSVTTPTFREFESDRKTIAGSAFFSTALCAGMGGYWNSSDFESQFRIFCGPSGKR